MTATTTRPRVLVLDSYAGAASRAVRRQGGEPITVNPRDIAAVDEAIAAGFDALLLTGGGDVDPRLYGEKPHRRVYGVNETRDLSEWIALDAAREAGVPVLGICRGMQLMAVHNGGRLKQHIEGHRGNSHLVIAERGTTYRKVAGNAGVFVSLHHQVVLRTGKGWRVAARDKAGRIEAIESKDGRCLGTQFHPEMDTGTNPQSREFFRWLVVAAAKTAGLPKPTRRKPARTSAKAKHRPAGQRTLPLPRPSGAAMQTTWVCRDCGMRFDKRADRDDHEDLFHTRADELYARIVDASGRATEPPPGHPDWD